MKRGKPAQRRVHRVVRMWNVLDMKLAGKTDREIQRELKENEDHPIDISHTQVWRDWHEALDEYIEDVKDKLTTQQMMAGARLERVLQRLWPLVLKDPPDLRAVELVIKVIHEIRQLYGLDRELGDEDRPIHTRETSMTFPIDYSTMTEKEADVILGLFERQNLALPPGDTDPERGPEGSGESQVEV